TSKASLLKRRRRSSSCSPPRHLVGAPYPYSARMTATSTTSPGEATRRGPARAFIAAALGLVSMPLVFFFALAAWPLMIVGFALAAVSIRRRDRVWGFGAAAIAAVWLALVRVVLG